MIQNIHCGNAKDYVGLIPASVLNLPSVVIRTENLSKPDQRVEDWCIYTSKRARKPVGFMPGNIGTGSLLMILECAGIKATHEPAW
jgi:hypothetical protein